MDNVTHTLVGAALARTGLGRRTRLGAATLMIGANFPDIDVIAVPLGHSVDFRRGWTHGVLALAVLPFILAGLMIVWGRMRERSHGGGPPVRPAQILILSAIGILTHPTLDWLNEYGMRWLMPFDGRWFYGDSLFIIDPWLLLLLAGGVVASRRRARSFAMADEVTARRAAIPARLALAAALTYMVAMLGLGRSANAAAHTLLRHKSVPATGVMTAASFANPARWRVVVEQADRYRVGHVRLLPTAALDLPHTLLKRDDHPAARAAARTASGRRFLVWSRFPFYEIEPGSAGTRVRISDARYSLGAVARAGARDWAHVTVTVPPVGQ